MKLKYLWNTLICVTALLFASVSSAEIYTGLFSEKAVGGYDTVAYFADGEPKKGKKKYKVKYMEATWFFSSAKNKELFEADPEKYSPQYGGHCAWAVGANSAKAPGNPKYWKIVDDKLYLNYSADVQKKWFKDVPGFIEKADKNWPEIAE